MKDHLWFLTRNHPLNAFALIWKHPAYRNLKNLKKTIVIFTKYYSGMLEHYIEVNNILILVHKLYFRLIWGKVFMAIYKFFSFSAHNKRKTPFSVLLFPTTIKTLLKLGHSGVYVTWGSCKQFKFVVESV